MAKIKEVKSEVNFLTNEIISDCNTFISLHPEKKDAAIKLVEEAVELRNTLVQKINHPKEKTNKYFKSIKHDLIEGADGIFEKLRKLIK